MQLDNLNTKILGRNCIYYETIDSTQNEVWRLYEENKVPSGTVVMADFQTHGKGTHGRKWYTEQANNIAFSFFIKMDCNINRLEGIAVKIAEIIVNIMKEKYKISVDIKEPNDLIINYKKLGGILTETKVIGNKVKCFVVGIGINVAQEEFADEIKNIATSIKNETGRIINVKEFISNFCNEFEKYLFEIGLKDSSLQ